MCVVAIFSLPTLSASYKTWVLLTSPYNHINQSNKTKPNEPKPQTTRRKEKATKHNQILQTQQKTDAAIDCQGCTACLTGDKDPPGIFQGAWKIPGAAKSSEPWKFPGPWKFPWPPIITLYANHFGYWCVCGSSNRGSLFRYRLSQLSDAAAIISSKLGCGCYFKRTNTRTPHFS